MIIGIVSDTHGHVENAHRAARLLATLEVELVLHCGDIGSPEIIAAFQRWPTHFVFGNVDSRPEPLIAAIEAARQTCHGRFGSLDLAGRRVAFLHGDDARLLVATIDDRQYDLVCYGHTHQPDYRCVGTKHVVNPGALFRANPHSLAVARLPELEVTHYPIE
jgi:uncharacterized protein